ncbi:hypothetical protein [Melittangium boletus]|uniref:hypothetical protein n=1 Tax=Melittangium boletus TaxID=83453 RepID=UPI003DA4D6D0
MVKQHECGSAVLAVLSAALVWSSPAHADDDRVTYTLRQGDSYDHALTFGGGLLLAVPGTFGGELFANATDATFAPNLYLDARAHLSYGPFADSFSYNYSGSVSTTFGLQLKAGFVPTFWGYGTTNIGVSDDRSLKDVPTAKAWGVGPFGGLDVLVHPWQPEGDPAGRRLGFSPTLMGGLHIERSVDVAADIEGWGYHARADKIAVDMAATYGLFGPHQGLGALLQLRWTLSSLFGQQLYMGGDLGGVLFNPNDRIGIEPDAGVLDTFTDTVRFGLSVGLVFSSPGHSRLPELDMECVRQHRTTTGCPRAP